MDNNKYEWLGWGRIDDINNNPSILPGIESFKAEATSGSTSFSGSAAVFPVFTLLAAMGKRVMGELVKPIYNINYTADPPPTSAEPHGNPFTDHRNHPCYGIFSSRVSRLGDFTTWLNCAGLLMGIPYFCSAFLCHFNVFSVFSELRNPTQRRLKKVMRRTIYVAGGLYSTIALCGFFTAAAYENYSVSLKSDFAIKRDIKDADRVVDKDAHRIEHDVKSDVRHDITRARRDVDRDVDHIHSEFSSGSFMENFSEDQDSISTVSSIRDYLLNMISLNEYDISDDLQNTNLILASTPNKGSSKGAILEDEATCLRGVQGNILKNFPADSVVVNIGRFSLFFALFSTLPLLVHPCRASVHRTFFGDNHTSTNLQHLIETIALMGSAFCIAVMIPQVQVILGYAGSTFGILLAFVFPST